MGLLSWFKGNSKQEPKPTQPLTSSNSGPESSPPEVPGMNGAVEVPRPAGKVTVFEFGSVNVSGDKFTLAGYCPVSDDLEPCRWEILPADDADAPQFRVVF